MDEKKLGTESAYPTIDTPRMSKRLFIAMNFAIIIAQEYFKKDSIMRSELKNLTGIIKIAYKFADELLKQENL